MAVFMRYKYIGLSLALDILKVIIPVGVPHNSKKP